MSRCALGEKREEPAGLANYDPKSPYPTLPYPM